MFAMFVRLSGFHITFRFTPWRCLSVKQQKVYLLIYLLYH